MHGSRGSTGACPGARNIKINLAENALLVIADFVAITLYANMHMTKTKSVARTSRCHTGCKHGRPRPDPIPHGWLPSHLLARCCRNLPPAAFLSSTSEDLLGEHFAVVLDIGAIARSSVVKSHKIIVIPKQRHAWE